MKMAEKRQGYSSTVQKNPRKGTLYAIAFSIEAELSTVFLRTMEGAV